MTGWRRWVESRVGELDTVLPYRTQRTLKIRDCRLGLALLTLQLAIAGYVVGYQLAYNQQYKVQGDVLATSRLQLQRPSLSYRWPDGAAPYCVNGTGLLPNATGAPRYIVNPATGSYRYTGPGGISANQLPCLMLDELYAVPDSMERDAIMLTTRLTVSTQAATPLPDCAGIAHEYCTFQIVNNTDYYVADPEFFTLLVDHSMYSPQAGLTRTVRQMAGRMKVRPPLDPNVEYSIQSPEERDKSAPSIDPCDAYTSSGLVCPSFVNVGSIGSADIFPIRTVLQAAGLQTLDLGAQYNTTETLRYGGIVLVLEVEYSNYGADTGSWNGDDVSYTYWVSAVPASEYKVVQAQGIGADGNTPAPPVRTVYNRHGVRIVLSFSGRIGSFNLQAFLINLFVSLGLLGAANALMEWIIFYLPLPTPDPAAKAGRGCPKDCGACTALCCSLFCGKSGGGTFVRMRHLYRAYKERETVDFNDLVRSSKIDPDALEHLLSVFTPGQPGYDPHMVDPVPSVFQPVIDMGRSAAAEERDSAAMHRNNLLTSVPGVVLVHRAGADKGAPGPQPHGSSSGQPRESVVEFK